MNMDLQKHYGFIVYLLTHEFIYAYGISKKCQNQHKKLLFHTEMCECTRLLEVSNANGSKLYNV